MSWLYSRALVADYSERISALDGEQSALLSATSGPQAYCSPDRMTAFSRLSRFGMTFAPLTAAPGEELLMLFLADFPARTLAIAGSRLELMESDPASGGKWQGSFARYSRESFSWRTSQRCLIEGLAPYSETWPSSGLMLDGACWELQTLEAASQESGFGLWPTLKASDGDQYTRNLGYFQRRAGVAPDLPVIVALNTPPTEQGFYGRINPEWAEWLMGLPTAWTAFGSLGMDKIHEWQQQHSAYFPASTDAA